ncbi:hypothetical protein GN244_ATG17868 [Phytophthora infestans]|uniref:Uncharacterized protein n=1 Tax=Phytophthora infestans TaxID=4787 RepID=A0A833SRQ9_PHYIN|nr:hypothetical protein GN244_ATG17868 [Phytophthora infestans]
MDRERIERDITELSHRLDTRTGSPNAADVDKCLDLLDEVDAYLTHSVFGSDRDVDPEPNIVALGTTGAGKSTVVSFLFGERIFVRHASRYSRVLVAIPALDGIEIRSGSVSASLLPIVNHVSMQDEDVAVWDMPGYRDTRGPFVKLVVHFIFQWMLKADKPLKFILVSPPLHERPQIVMLQDMINSSLIRRDNAIIVYTKCGPEFDPNSTSDLKIVESKLDIRSYALPAPAPGDFDGHDYSQQYCGRKCEILQTLRGLHASKVEHDEKLPDAAKLLLKLLTESCVHFVQEELSARFLENYNWESYKATFEEISNTLEALKCPDKIPLNTLVSILSRVAPADYDNDPALCRAKHRLSVVETLHGAKEKLLELRNAVKAYRSTHEMHDSLVISAFQLRLSEELETINEFVRKHKAEYVLAKREVIPIVTLIGYASLDIDVNIQMWVEIAFISPTIVVTTSRAMDLSAKCQAKSATRINDDVGRHGAHGEPGLPGGDLTVVCKKLQDDLHVLQSTVSNGQRGGDAQNGGDGADGADSSFCVATFEEMIHCEIEHGLLNRDYSAPAGLEGGLQLVEHKRNDSPLSGRVYGTPGVANVVVKKDSESGKPRIQAGDGGRGGAGGQGGKLFIMQANQNVWEGVGLMGRQGCNGKPGKASHDGYGSPSFTATIQQWYCRGGWFGNNFADPEIDIQVEELRVEGQPKVAHGGVSKGNGILAEADDDSPFNFVMDEYRHYHSKLADAFSQCDFSDFEID